MLAAKWPEALRDLLTRRDIVLVLAGRYLGASRLMTEGEDRSWGHIVWPLQREHETSLSWRDDSAALGFVAGKGDIETVRGSSMRRFYRSGSLEDAVLPSECAMAE
jgi:hypothetical protein